MEEKFYKDGLRFSCKRCSFCCTGFPGVVLLSEDDLRRLADWAGLSDEQFTLAYCRWIENDEGTKYLSLRERQNCECIFWKDGCEAYEARPVQCRTYPFWTNVMESLESWSKECGDCPGMNQGNLHTADEIEEEIFKYMSRVPIKKEK